MSQMNARNAVQAAEQPQATNCRPFSVSLSSNPVNERSYDYFQPVSWKLSRVDPWNRLLTRLLHAVAFTKRTLGPLYGMHSRSSARTWNMELWSTVVTNN